MRKIKPLLCKTIGVCVLSTVSVALSGMTADAQQVTDLNLPMNSDMFSQQLTDAVTQGFRQEQDRLFFIEGVQQFQEEIRLLQNEESADPILNVGPVFDDWQSIENTAEIVP